MPKGLAHSFFIPYETSRVEIVSDLKRIYIKYQDNSVYQYIDWGIHSLLLKNSASYQNMFSSVQW